LPHAGKTRVVNKTSLTGDPNDDDDGKKNRWLRRGGCGAHTRTTLQHGKLLQQQNNINMQPTKQKFYFLKYLQKIKLMGKIRAKDVKPKGHGGGDFKKKSATVGRKVKRSNVTEIKVQSRRINMPQQLSTSSLAKEDGEIEDIKIVIRQLHHHNDHTRIGALEKMKRQLSDVDLARRQITLVLPEALELLFHEDRDTREALINLSSFLSETVSSEYFESIIAVMVTYLCSGLTNVHKVNCKYDLCICICFILIIIIFYLFNHVWRFCTLRAFGATHCDWFKSFRRLTQRC
jgi:hypothetical protein